MKKVHTRSDIGRHLEEAGFSLIELIATIGITMLLAIIGIPEFAALNGNLKSSQDARVVGSKLATWRAEAARLRNPVTVTFYSSGSTTPATFAADFDGDGNDDEIVTLSKNTDWSVNGAPGTPASFTITGLGFIPAVGNTGLSIGFDNYQASTTITVYSTGVISYS